MDDITPKEANEILSHYTDLGYGIVIEGEDTSKIKQALSLASKTLKNGTPYNPIGDLICREALKKKIREYTEPSSKLSDDFSIGMTECACEILDMIDNAPTVEPICPYLSDNEIKQPCLNSPCERPQGECCGSCYLCDVGDCGADMKGGAK